MPKSVDKGVAGRLAALRRSQSETQAEFAARLGVSVNTYIKWEHGSVETPAWVFLQAHKLFHVDVLWLLSGEGKAFGGEPTWTRIRITELAEALAIDVVDTIAELADDHHKRVLPRILELSLLRHIHAEPADDLPVKHFLP